MTGQLAPCDGDSVVVDAELVDADGKFGTSTSVRRVPVPGFARGLVVPDENDPDDWLPPEAAEDVAAGVPESTRRSYDGDWRRFAAWCVNAGRRPLPAAAATVTAYASHLKRTPRPRTGKPYNPSSIERAFSAIRVKHLVEGLVPPDFTGARKVLAGYRAELAKRNDPAARPRRVTPARVATLRKLLAGLDRDTLAGKRDAALILLAYTTAARASELVRLDVGCATPSARGMYVQVYRVKTKRFDRPEVLHGRHPDTCPVLAYEHWLAALAGHGRTAGPLFVRIDRYGRLAVPLTRHGRPIGDPAGRMTTDAVADIIERAAERAALTGRFRSHSPRRGYATDTTEREADPLKAKRHGGWSDNSASFAGYIDDAPGPIEDNPLYGIGL